MFLMSRCKAIFPLFTASLVCKTHGFSSSSSNHRSSSTFAATLASAAAYAANNPMEDRYISWHNSTTSVVGVFDGHGGAQVAHYAQNIVISVLESNAILDETFDISKAESQKELVKCFQEIEDGYLRSIRDAYKLGFGAVASVGCCALIAIRKGQHLLIANCGDCRAVLGKRVYESDGRFYSRAETCTNDHNCRRPIEQLKLRLQHPGESDVYVCKANNLNACYVKRKLQLTRSIGDAYLKYSEFNAPANLHKTRGRHIPEPYTPPYISHVPELHYINLSTDDRFLILATDGVWDFITDKMAVDIVESCAQDDNQGEAASVLVEKTLERAAVESGVTVDALKRIPAGSVRRRHHDDTTVVVLDLRSGDSDSDSEMVGKE